MDNIIVKVTKIFTILFMVAGTVFTALVIWNAGDLKGNPALTATLLNPYFGIAATLLVLGVLSILVFVIIQYISNPKAAVRALISIGILAVIYAVAYFGASGNIDAPVYEKFDISSSESKIIGSMINLVYILGSVAILAIMGSSVYKLTLKK